METPKQLIDTRANVLLGDTTAPSPKAFGMKAPIRTLGTVPAPEDSVRWARIGFGCFRSSWAVLKPTAGGIRRMPPAGSPKGEGRHDQAPEESQVVRLIHPKAEPVPMPSDMGAGEIVRRSGFRSAWTVRHRRSQSHRQPRFARSV